MITVFYSGKKLSKENYYSKKINNIISNVKKNLQIPKNFPIDFRIKYLQKAEGEIDFDYIKKKNKALIYLNRKILEDDETYIYSHLKNLFITYVIIHELVHLEQFLTGKLKVKKNSILWRKKDNTYKKYSRYHILVANLDFKSYLKLEWEREAINTAIKLLFSMYPNKAKFKLKLLEEIGL